MANKNKKCNTSLMKKIEKAIIEVAIDVAKLGEGALFVIGCDVKYDLLFPDLMSKKKMSIFQKDFKRALIKIATLDGAVIIDEKGYVQAYGAHIKNSLPFPGYGTRHAAARGASKKDAIAVLVSEEEKIIRIFRKGNLYLEINPFAKNIEKNVPNIVNALDQKVIDKISTMAGAGAGLASAGTAAALGGLGIVVLPGVFIFMSVAGTAAGSYFLIRRILKSVFRKK